MLPYKCNRIHLFYINIYLLDYTEFFDDERALQGGYHLNSPLKIVKPSKIGARGAEYLCKVTIAARSRFAHPPARRVGIAFPVRRRRGVPCRPWVYRAAVGCTVPPWVYRAAVGSAQLARRGGKSTSAGRFIPPWWGLTVVFGV